MIVPWAQRPGAAARKRSARTFGAAIAPWTVAAIGGVAPLLAVGLAVAPACAGPKAKGKTWSA